MDNNETCQDTDSPHNKATLEITGKENYWIIQKPVRNSTFIALQVRPLIFKVIALHSIVILSLKAHTRASTI